MFPSRDGWRKKVLCVVVWTWEWGSSWGETSWFRLASRVCFFFFPVLHHPEPNRAMLLGVGVAATVSGQLVPQRKRVLFCNYKITIVDYTLLTWLGRAIESQYGEQSCISPQPTVLVLVPVHYFCPDLVASLHNANHVFFFFYATQAGPAKQPNSCQVAVLRRLAPPAGPR